MTDTNANSKSAKVEKQEANPLALVAGGVALGLAVGALLPRLQKERDMLAPVGKKLAEGATAAATAAREVGKNEINALLPQADVARGQLAKVLTSALEAAKSATGTKSGV